MLRARDADLDAPAAVAEAWLLGASGDRDTAFTLFSSTSRYDQPMTAERLVGAATLN